MSWLMSGTAVGAVGALALAAALWGLHELRPAGRVAALEPVGHVSRRRRDLTGFVVRWAAAPLLPVVSRLLAGHRMERARGRILAAGSPAGLTATGYLQARSCVLLFGGIASVSAVLSGSLVTASAWAAASWFLVDGTVTYLAARRQQQIDRQVPDMLDVLVLLTGAGLSFPSALERTAAAIPAPLGAELTMLILQRRMGYAMTSGLNDVVRRNPSPALRRVVNALQEAVTTGSPIAEALASMASDFRSMAMQEMRRRAGRNSVLVVLVVTTLGVPAALLLAGGMLVFGGAAGDFVSRLLP